jgi:imidazolonepropionase-like amidohydrolase
MRRIWGSSTASGKENHRGIMLVAALLLVASAPAAFAQTTAIVGATVHPISGPKIDNGVVVLEGGRIAAVGPASQVEIPAGAQRIDARGKVVTPGFFDAATHVGLVEVSNVPSTRDESLQSEDPIRASFRVSAGINPRSTVIPVTRAGGVTLVVSTPTGGAVAGQGVIINLAGRTLGEMRVREPAAVYAALNPGAAESVGGARGALAARLREVLDDARFFARHRDAFVRGGTREMSASRLDLEALQPVLAGELPLVVRASRASDIDEALRIAEEYGIDLIIEGGEEAWIIADLLAAAEVPVIVKPLSSLPVEFDRLGTRYDNAAILQRAGVPIILSTLDTHNARLLGQEAGNAVRFGLPWEAALRAMTRTPAEAFGIADRYGSLEPGMVADVVVWSGDPFALSTHPERVFIRGRAVTLDSRQKRLLERYRDLDPRPAEYEGQR